MVIMLPTSLNLLLIYIKKQVKITDLFDKIIKIDKV